MLLNKSITVLAARIFLLGAAVVAQISTGGCNPSACTAICNPPCILSQVCTLGTMTQCGVCPTPKCVDRSVFGIDPSSSSAAASPTSITAGGDNNGSASLIGGLVGGLVGGAVLFAIVGFCTCRRYKRNNTMTFQLPLTSHSQQLNEKSSTTISGVIPVKYVPPSPQQEEETPTPSSDFSIDQRRSHYLSVTSARLSRHPEDRDDYSQRTSTASSLSNHPITPVKASQAIQLSRARPQIMRVNQIRANTPGTAGSSSTNLSRSGSLRTITLTPERDHRTLSRSNTAPTRRGVNRSSTLVDTTKRPSTIINIDTQHLEQVVSSNSLTDPFHDRHSAVDDQDTHATVDSETTIYLKGAAAKENEK